MLHYASPMSLRTFFMYVSSRCFLSPVAKVIATNHLQMYLQLKTYVYLYLYTGSCIYVYNFDYLFLCYSTGAEPSTF